ncbi:DUF3450 domain-containing protein [Candidatus Foliamicus sp.]
MKPVLKGLLCAGGLLAAAAMASATTLEEIEAEQAERIEAGRQSQSRIDDIVKETDSLEYEYKRVLKELEGLKVFNTLMERQIDRQEADIALLNEAIDEVEASRRQMMPLMVRMIEALDMFVEADAPFLLDERRARVAGLRDLMEREDVSVAEKFRKVLEAYQIENEYGNTIEAYKDAVEHEGGILEVDVLRIGRVALVYQTADLSATRRWDRDAKAWVDLEGSYRNQVRLGLRVANEMVAPELLLLPVPGPEAG